MTERPRFDVRKFAKPGETSPASSGRVLINRLARELDVKSAVILDTLPRVGATDKYTHSSSVDQAIAARIRQYLSEHPPITTTERPRPRFDFSKIAKHGDVARAISRTERINDLARELEVKSIEILNALSLVGVVDRHTHSSLVSRDVADRIRKYFAENKPSQHPANPEVQFKEPVARGADFWPARLGSVRRALIIMLDEIEGVEGSTRKSEKELVGVRAHRLMIECKLTPAIYGDCSFLLDLRNRLEYEDVTPTESELHQVSSSITNVIAWAQAKCKKAASRLKDCRDEAFD